jgi:nitrite reductase/ring-hydroxylating ferredoxin subunit
VRRDRVRQLLGIPATALPEDPDCWLYDDGQLVIDLRRAPELDVPDGALRFEGRDLPVRVLVFAGDDGRFHAMHNRCGHRGRRLDPEPGTGTVRCCGTGRSVYDYGGRVLSGRSRRAVVTCPVRRRDDRLLVTISCTAHAVAGLRSKVLNPA